MAAARSRQTSSEAVQRTTQEASEGNEHYARMAVCSVLESINPLPEVAPQLLLMCFNDSNPRVRKRAISVASRVYCDDPAIVAALIESLDDPQTCVEAMKALGSLGPAAKPAVVPLSQFLVSEDPSVKLSAAQSVWSISGDAPKVLPAAQSVLRNEQDAMLLREAAGLLGDLATEARPAVDYVKRLLQHDEISVQAVAKRAIAKINAEYIVRRRSRIGQGSGTIVYSL